MSAGDWFSAFLDAAPDLKLPPACPYGQEEGTASSQRDKRRSQYANGIWYQINYDYGTDEDVAIHNASTSSDMTIESTKLRDRSTQSSLSCDEAIEQGSGIQSPLCPAGQMLQENLRAAHTNASEADGATKRDTPAQPDLQTETHAIRARDAGPPTRQTDEMNLKPTPNHWAPCFHRSDAHSSSSQVDLPIAVQPSHHKSSNTSLPISGHRAKKELADGAAKAKGANEVLLEPIDYGKKCDVCKVHSIWKRTATLCFDCLANSPSQAKRREVIRRALVGIGSCSSCYEAEDNGADRHCLSCTQRQRDKNARRKARKARGETWVPKGKKTGGNKTSKSKRSSKSAGARKRPKKN
ncbi:hypothetical protein GE21DRAFT_5024 [Neurospora crassa]|uniref:Uncharacterized protein n=1 Tax=Neurospora crassa (strain ATCC 24698 / 74-OR23-1A / CBS 708.71 / DSM 1257 / FGSC 987) TaxID=367110 RepID=Q7S3K1_NEUCR|nr:hypothetical protein NCU08242 [Neurospora crassa OR74A]EAA30096.1 hypothetical protein NCU08242 [Neurospora crassa OR74A]KHE86498.1 hypothetical protein GE21DRAFT_5024 [Neurospora crassa]|eukprot:XP_959332.1 hypothetical protein NCU08242 [Neurospora crassa OR74A]